MGKSGTNIAALTPSAEVSRPSVFRPSSLWPSASSRPTTTSLGSFGTCIPKILDDWPTIAAQRRPRPKARRALRAPVEANDSSILSYSMAGSASNRGRTSVASRQFPRPGTNCRMQCFVSCSTRPFRRRSPTGESHARRPATDLVQRMKTRLFRISGPTVKSIV
jgi:hypothetical protein